MYTLLVNWAQFLQEHSSHAHHQSVNVTRALLCEIVASKVLEHYDSGDTDSGTLLQLAKILVTDFDPFQAMAEKISPGSAQEFPRGLAPSERDGPSMKSTALRLAIISESKSFLSSSACQKAIDAIHKGRVIYTPFPPIDILPDHYKPQPISIYNPASARLLNQYRLIAPHTRYILEACQFGTSCCHIFL